MAKQNLPNSTSAGIPNIQNLTSEAQYHTTLYNSLTRTNTGVASFPSPSSGLTYSTNDYPADTDVYNKGETGLLNLLAKYVLVNYNWTAADANQIGDLSTLPTTEKSNLVGAIIEHVTENAIDAHATIPSARAYHNTNQSIANNTPIALSFNSERFDTDTIHDNVTNNSRLTCKTAGKYIITAGIDWEEAIGGDRQIMIKLNNTTILAADRRPASSAGQCNQTITTLYDLQLTDYVEVVVRHTQGNAINVISGGNYTPEFSMVKVG